MGDRRMIADSAGTLSGPAATLCVYVSVSVASVTGLSVTAPPPDHAACIIAVGRLYVSADVEELTRIVPATSCRA